MTASFDRLILRQAQDDIHFRGNEREAEKAQGRGFGNLGYRGPLGLAMTGGVSGKGKGAFNIFLFFPFFGV